MTDKFRAGDYVRKEGQKVLTGTIQDGRNHKGQYLVKIDPSCNDTEIFAEVLAYEDELEACSRPSNTN